MKLARIEHWRCGEPIGWKNGSGSTYVWVPDSMTEEEFSTFCENARQSYLLVEEGFKKKAPVYPPGYGPSIEHYPDTMTVAEIKADHAKKTAAYKTYTDECNRARKPYSWHLQLVSGGTIRLFYDVKPELEYELSWGHRHGTTIEHSGTDFGDYPPKTEDEDGL
jgi:hypothetical protein